MKIAARWLLLGMGLAFAVWIGAAAEASSALAQARPTPGVPGDRVAYHPETGLVSFIGFDAGDGPAVGSALAGRSLADQGEALLAPYVAAFGLRGVERDLRVESAAQGSVRFQQMVDGVPVVGGEVVVSISDDGRLQSISGEISPDAEVAGSPEVSASAAASTARQAVAKWYGLDPDSLSVSTPQEWILDERLLQASDRPPAMVWRVEVAARGGAPVRELVFVDAVRGGIALHWNQIDTSWGPAQLQDTDTPTATDTATFVSLPTETPSPTDTDTPVGTPSDTLTPSDTATQTVSPTFTWTPSQTPSPTPTSSVLYFDIVLDEERGRLYASNRSGGTIDVFSLSSLDPISSVPVGLEPTGIDISANGQELAVALRGGGAIAFVDLDTLEVGTLVVPTGLVGGTSNRPFDVIYDGANRLYSVGDPHWDTTDYVHAYDATTHTQLGVSTTSVYAEPHLGITPDGGFLYVIQSVYPPRLYRFDVTSETPILVNSAPPASVGGGDLAILPDASRLLTAGPQAWTPDLVRLWSEGFGGDHIEYIESRRMFAIGIGATYYRFYDADTYHIVGGHDFAGQAGVGRAVSDGSRLIVSTSGGLVDVDLTVFPPTRTPTATPPTATPTATGTLTPPPPVLYADLVLDDARNKIYGSNRDAGTIDIYALDTLQWEQSVHVGSQPVGMDLAPDGVELAIAMFGQGEILFLDLDSLSIAGAAVPDQPPHSGYGIHPSEVLYGRPGRLYSVSDNCTGFGDYLHVIDTESREEVARQGFVLDCNPKLAISADRTRLYATDHSSVDNLFYYDVSSDPPILRTALVTSYGISPVVLSDGRVFTSHRWAWSSDIETVLASTASQMDDKGDYLEYLPVQGLVAISNFFAPQISFVDVNNPLYAVVDRYPFAGSVGVLQAASDGSRLVVSTSGGLRALDLSTFPLPTASPTLTPTPSLTRTPTATFTRTPTRTPTATHTVTLTPSLNPSPFSGSRRTYNANDTFTLPGVYLCNESVEVCTGGAVPDADAAHSFTQDTLAFYASHHGRDSLDDSKMIVDSTVRYGVGFENAMWNGNRAVYGEGWARADDIVAHELTHGVTQFESGLLYYYQSGAISESFSDLWGEFVDQTNGEGNDDPSVKWLIGEDILRVGTLRSMSNPPAFGDPDRMTSGLYYKGSADYYYGAGDNGGVHTNSGVNNKAAYLLTDGGSFNGYTVRGLGIPKVAAIYYEAQTDLLTSGADYLDLYNLLFQACQNIVGGAEGITASDCLEVRDATNAVEMQSSPAAGYNPAPAACPAGTARNATLFSDDLESGGANWAFSALGGRSAWELADFYAVSGTHMLGGNDFYNLSDSVAAMAEDVSLPAGAFLRFSHAFGFEDPNWDGGVLEYSTDGGASWSDAEPLFSDGRAYGGSIFRSSSPSANPLQGRRAFIGDSHGYVGSRYNLATLAGDTVRFRWRLGTDGVVYDWGWFVDDVEIYTCVGAPGVPTLSSPANNALLASYTPNLDWADAASADRYQIQIATDSSFTSPLMDESVATSDFMPAVPLADNTTFWWRVRSFNVLNQASAWSSVRSFRTSVLVPVQVSPVDGEFLLTTRPTFDWSDVAGATGYTLNVSSSPSFSSLAVNKSSSVSAYTLTSDLSPRGAVLYWRVRATGPNGPSAWSIPQTLTSANPPSVPGPTSPASNALIQSYLPTLDWSDATGGGGVDHYTLQIAEDAGFSVGLRVIDESLSTHQASPALDPNKTYRWRVRSENGSGHYSQWSEVRTLRTVLPPPTGLGMTEVETTRPTFTWTAYAAGGSPLPTNYTLQVSAASNFASTVVNATTSGLGTSYRPTVDLPKGAALYWRLRVNGANGPSPWAGGGSWTSANPPNVPGLVSPAANALMTDLSPTLDWSDATGGLDHYQVQIATDVNFGTIVRDEDASVSTLTASPGLESNTTHWWRVRSWNGVGQYSNWSSVGTFRTALAPPTGLTSSDLALTTRPKFEWDPYGGVAPNPTNHTLQVSTSSTFASTAVSATASGMSYTPTVDLPKNVTLYWRLRANGANGPSLWTVGGSWTSADPPSVPGLVSPGSNSLTADPSPTLDWGDSSGGGGLDHYQVQIATDANFGAIVQVEEVGASTYTASPDLTSNMKHWWRVRSYNAGGEHSLWSSSRTFRTALAPPTGLTSADLALTTRPKFEWDIVSGATNYTIQLSTSATFGSTVVNATASGPGYSPTKDLPKGATLYWRVRANGANGPSLWADGGSWTSANPPSVPVPASPASNALLTDYSPSLDWSDAANGLDHYQVQVATNANFTSPLIDEASVMVSNYTPGSDLASNTTHWWRVRSWNGVGQYSNWSSVGTFRTALAPPTGLTSADLALTTRPKFEWDIVTGATNYTIQLSTSATFSPMVVNSAATGVWFIPSSDLPKGATLYWRLRANGANGPSLWTGGGSWTSANPPSVPVPASPASNALLTDYSPTLDWSDATGGGGVDHYQVQVSANSTFGAILRDEDVVGSNYTVVPDLAPNTTYWWRVRSWNADSEYSLWSAVRTFRTALSPAVLSNPTEAATLTTLRPVFDWNDIAGATSYTLQVSTNSLFTSYAINVNPATSTYTPTANLPTQKVLDVRVRANGVNGPSLWTVVSFIIIP